MIADVLIEPLLGGFFHDDQAALRVGSPTPLTPGFDAIRMPARAVGIGLVLDDGTTVWGDAISVQYAGAGGRDPIVTPDMLEGWDPRGIETTDWLIACDQALGSITHAGLRYGISQALLAATAATTRRTMAEVVAGELGLELVLEPVPLFAQSGELRRENVPRMIAKRVAALPHGLFSTPAAFAQLPEYARWLKDQLDAVPDYAPTLQFDLYGQAGVAFASGVDAVAGFLHELERAVAPYALRIESPIDFGSRQAQIDGGIALRAALRDRGATLTLIADEWCNTLQDAIDFAAAGACDMVQIKTPDVGSLADSARAVIACREHGVGAYLGGSCTETEVSARACVHVALAVRPDVMLAKPGMGVDEGIMLAANEQRRTIARLMAREETSR